MSIISFLMFRTFLFFGELLFFSIPFVYKKERRNFFWLRLVTSLLVIIGILFAFVYVEEYFYRIYEYSREIELIMVLILNFLMFSLFTGLNFFVFKETIFNIFGTITQSLSIRQLCYCFYFLMITFVGDKFNFLVITGVTFANFMIYLGVYLAISATYFVLVRKIVFKEENNLTKSLLSIYIFVVMMVLIIHSVSETYSTDGYSILIQMAVLGEITALVAVFAMDYLIRYTNRLKNENSLTLKLLEEQGNQFKFSKANSEDIRIKAHDLKHQVKILREGGPDAEKLLSELEDTISDYESTIYLDNHTIGIILRDKYAYCKKHKIKLSYISDPEAFMKVSNIDLYTLIGNIIDNAIEATMNLKNKNLRVISVNVSHKNGISSIRCDNYYEGTLNIENGIYKTRKIDAKNHGFGIRSIDVLAKKYGGFVDIKTDNQIFVLRVSIPDSE